MSAQAGIFYFDGRPIEPTLPERLNAELAEFGPDGSGEYTAAGLVMVHRALHVTPEDSLERQPYVSARGNVMTWDGRLDNRDDLLLQLWRDLRDDTTDVALAMAAYEKWGEDGFARLIGDWSLVIWEGERQELTLGSDYAANRGLFYAAGDRQLVWSSSLGVLVELTGLGHDIETRFAVGYLTGAIPPAFTPYKGVLSVLPAHAVTWTRNGFRSARRFWDLSAESLRYHDPREYETEFRLLFREAVVTRLRARGPVWAELSGGFDSSAIVCMADRVLRDGAGVGRSLETVSYVTSQAPASNERRFIEAVEKECNLRGHHFALETHFGSTDAERQWVTPFHPSGAGLREYRLVHDCGGRVLLSGAAGDAVTTSSADDPAPILEPLLGGRPVASIMAARAWSRACQRPIWTVALELLVHFAPRRINFGVQLARFFKSRGIPSTRSVESAVAEAFLLPATLADLWLDEFRRRASRIRTAGHIAKSAWLASVLAYVDAAELQAPTEFPGVHCTLPFMHRPLVGFAMATPAGVLCAPGEPRALMKRALRDILPARVAQRISKGYVVEPFRQQAVRAFAVSSLDHIRDLHAVKHGFVDDQKLLKAFEKIAAGGHDFANLRRLLKLERWLRALSDHGTRSQSFAGLTQRESVSFNALPHA